MPPNQLTKVEICEYKAVLEVSVLGQDWQLNARQKLQVSMAMQRSTA